MKGGHLMVGLIGRSFLLGWSSTSGCRWRFQESLLKGPEDEQADQYNNAENQCEDRHLLDS
jgi:hypothetical protein